jgi:DNA polymerase-4
VTQSHDLFGDGPTIARAIRKAIQDELRLTASAGVATSKFVAKVASDLEKPNGLTIVQAGTEALFLRPLPVERMWGVGPKAAEKLRHAGVRTIGDLAAAHAGRLEAVMGSEWGGAIHELAQGIDDRPVVPERDAVSIGAEETYDEDLTTVDAIERELLIHSERVAQRLAAQGNVASTVAIKVKYSDFTLITRRLTLDEPVADTTSIHRAACGLLKRVVVDGRRIRLTGVAVSNIVDAERVPRLLFPDEARKKRDALEQVALAASERFGAKALVHAETLGTRGRRRP